MCLARRQSICSSGIASRRAASRSRRSLGIGDQRVIAPNNGPTPQQPQHFWQKPGCAASIGVTAVGALATAGEAAAIWFVGPEFLALAGEAVAEETAEGGALGGGGAKRV